MTNRVHYCGNAVRIWKIVCLKAEAGVSMCSISQVNTLLWLFFIYLFLLLDLRTPVASSICVRGNESDLFLVEECISSLTVERAYFALNESFI